MEKQWIVLPQRNQNPFSENYIVERARTLYSTLGEAEERCKSLAKQYHGTSFSIFELKSTTTANLITEE